MEIVLLQFAAQFNPFGSRRIIYFFENRWPKHKTVIMTVISHQPPISSR